MNLSEQSVCQANIVTTKLSRFMWSVWFSLVPADVPEEHLVAGHIGARLVVSGVDLKLAIYHCGF